MGRSSRFHMPCTPPVLQATSAHVCHKTVVHSGYQGAGIRKQSHVLLSERVDEHRTSWSDLVRPVVGESKRINQTLLHSPSPNATTKLGTGT